jgi:hypothetical protein
MMVMAARKPTMPMMRVSSSIAPGCEHLSFTAG